jgi:hypothetical protein
VKLVSSGPKVTVSGSGPKQRKLVRVRLSRCTTIHSRDMQALGPHAGILASDRKLRNGNAQSCGPPWSRGLPLDKQAIIVGGKHQHALGSYAARLTTIARPIHRRRAKKSG